MPKNSKKIVIENSKNIKLKEQIELKYDNIEVVINENLGMGASNNKGILMSTTHFALILNPDTRFLDNTFDTLISEANHIDDFAIILYVMTEGIQISNFIKKKFLITKYWMLIVLMVIQC